jgi:cell division protein FtsB
MASDDLIPGGDGPRVVLPTPGTERPSRTPRLTFHGSVLVMTLVALLLMAVPPARQFYREQSQMKAAQQRLAALKRDNAQLEGQLARLKDPAYLERLAREELGVVRPGEIGFVVVPGDPAPEQAPAPAKPAPWYERIMRSLKSAVGAG